MAGPKHAFDLFVHFKQGDDLFHHLERHPKNPVQALRDWADCLAAGAETVREVASTLEGAQCDIHADTHHIGIHLTDDAIAARLSVIEGIERELVEDEEELDDDDLVLDDDDESPVDYDDGRFTTD